jgi:hypothetical protein
MPWLRRSVFNHGDATPSGVRDAGKDGKDGHGGTLAIRSRSEPQIKVRRPAGLRHHLKQTTM